MKKNFLFLLFIVMTTMVSAQKYVGGDISMLKKFLDEGAVFKDKDGNVVQPLEFFKAQGWNAMRIRLFVDPANASSSDRKEGAIQDLDYVIALSKDIKAAGFKLMLDFHYSDTWTDPGQHSTPSAWSSMTVDQLKTQVYEYTKECLDKLNKAGATPDFIQTGNEITVGMLWPTGHIYASGGAPKGGSWDNFAGYLANAIKACNEMCPEAQIVIHTEMHAASDVIKFYQQLANYTDVKYDIIGLSYYPDWHGALSVIDQTLTTLESKFADKKIQIVETGYGFEWQLSGPKYDFTSTYPLTDEGQRKWTADFIEVLNQHTNVNGLFWWYPEYTLNNIVFKGGSEDWSKNFTAGYWNASLFHYKTGNAHLALYELKNFVGDDTGINTTVIQRATDDTWYTLDGRRLNGKPVAKGLYICNGRKVLKQ